MADERHDIEVNVEGNAEEKLDKIASSSEKTSKATDDLSKSSGKLKLSLDDLATGAAAVFAIVATGLKVIYDATKAYAQQAASLGRLSASVKRAGGSYQQFQKLSDTARDASNNLGIALVDVQDAARTLADASGDAATAERDLKLALDISAASGRELSEVSKDLSAARKGEFDTLKQYAGFNKELVEGLVANSDAASAANEAFKSLEATYSGSSETLKGAEERIKSLATRFDNLEASIGGVLSNMADLATSEGSTGGEALGFFDEGAQRLEEMTRAAAIMATQRETFAPLIAGAADSIRNGEDLSEVLNRITDQVIEINEMEPIAPVVGDGEFTGPAPLSADEARKKRIADTKRRDRERKQREADARRRAKEEESKASRAGESMAASVLGSVDEGIRAKEENDALNEQIRIRDEIARAKLEGRDLDAMLLELENSKLTPLERQLALTNEIKKQNADADAEAMRKGKKKAKDTKEQLDEEEAAIAARNDAIRAGASGAIAVAEMAGAGERQIAALRGAMEAAEAVAAGASGNIAGAIAHGVASAQFLAIAGGAGGSSGGGGSPGGGASRARSVAADASANRAGFDNGEPRTNNVTLQFNAAFAPSPRDARKVTDAVETELRNRSGFGSVR